MTQKTFTYKTTLVGNGQAYGWNKFDEKGEIVESSDQTWNTEADAEKHIRMMASEDGSTVEVSSLKNVNSEDNEHVNIHTKEEEVVDMYNGMTPVTESIDEKLNNK